MYKMTPIFFSHSFIVEEERTTNRLENHGRYSVSHKASNNQVSLANVIVHFFNLEIKK